MSDTRKPTAIEKRTQNQSALAPFSLSNLKSSLPLVFPLDPDLSPSPKLRYRSTYRYLGSDPLNEKTIEVFSPFEIAVYLFDYSHLERLLAAHIYQASAKGQVPFHPVSMYLLAIYRRERNLSRNESLRLLQHPTEGLALRRCTGFEDEFPSESGLRYFEKQITPHLQREINALQIDALYHAGLLLTKPAEEKQVTLTFDGMLHHARSRIRCSSVQASCYEPVPRSCPAQDKNKQGCDCTDHKCADICRFATPQDPDARFIVYSGNNKRARKSPNAPKEEKVKQSRSGRMTYGYYSYAGQMLDDQLSTYWTLPTAFGSATCGDPALFPDNFVYLQQRFPWLKIEEVIADAALCEQNCLDHIWHAGALRMVDICAHKSDAEPEICWSRGYDKHGHPLCPFGYVLRSNGHDYQRRRTKWRCGKLCRFDSEREAPDCDYLPSKYKHGYTITIDRTHRDGTVRLAREIPYGTPAWKERYNRRNSAESRNGVLQRLGLKRMPVHGLASCHVTILQGDLVTNQRTLVRLIREATAGG